MKRTKTVTDAVIAANQDNAQESTGAKTERGKAASRFGAVKHGFTAKEPIPQNDDSAFQRLSALAELLPVPGTVGKHPGPRYYVPATKTIGTGET